MRRFRCWYRRSVREETVGRAKCHAAHMAGAAGENARRAPATHGERENWLAGEMNKKGGPSG